MTKELLAAIEAWEPVSRLYVNPRLALSRNGFNEPSSAVIAYDDIITVEALKELASLVRVWRAIADGLPEVGKEVVWRFSTGEVSSGEYLPDSSVVWVVGGEYPLSDFTHWMPIPEVE